MNLQKNAQVELDSTVLANSFVQYFENIEENETLEEPKLSLKQLRRINRGCLETMRATLRFSKKMERIMEKKHFDFEDCSPQLEEKEIVDIEIPIASLFENLSDYVYVALAS